MCTFSSKATAASSAGYAGLIVLNGERHPPLKQYGFDDSHSANLQSYPVIALEQSELSPHLVTALRSPTVSTHHVQFRLRVSVESVSSALLGTASSHLTQWRAAGRSTADVHLMQAEECAATALAVIEGALQAGGGDALLSQSAVEVHSFLGNLYHYHLQPPRPRAACMHYRHAIERTRRGGGDHLAALTNLATLLYKFSVVDTNTSNEDDGVTAPLSAERQEELFLWSKGQAQREATHQFAMHLEKILLSLKGGAAIGLVPTLVYNWGRDDNNAMRLEQVDQMSVQCGDSGLCLFNGTGVAACTGIVHFEMDDHSCVYGQTSPWTTKRPALPPLQLSPRGYRADPAHQHMLYLETREDVFVSVVKDSVVLGGVGVPVTFHADPALTAPSARADKLALNMTLWLPAPGLLVPLHSLLEADLDDFVMAIRNAVHYVSDATDMDAPANSNGSLLPSDILVVNGVQPSCNNYYHWMTQCWPRILVGLDLLLTTEWRPVDPSLSLSSSSTITVGLLVSALNSMDGQHVASIPFVEETLRLAGLTNGSVYRAVVSPALRTSLSWSNDVSAVRVLILQHPMYASFPSHTLLQVDWRSPASPSGDTGGNMEGELYTSVLGDIEAGRTDMYRRCALRQVSSCAGRCGENREGGDDLCRCCSLLSMIRNRGGLEYSVPRSVLAHVRTHHLLPSLHQQGQRTSRCAGGGEGEGKRYVLLISRRRVSSRRNGTQKGFTRLLLNEKDVERAILADIDSYEEATDDTRLIELVTLYGDGFCERKTSRRQRDRDSSGGAGICSCLPVDMDGNRVHRDGILFGSAAVIVGVHGAALANMVFAKPPAAVVEVVLETPRHRDYM